MSSWQKVYQDDLQYRVEIVKSVLEDRDFSPVIVNKKDSNYPLGHFEIQVPPDEVIRALKIINEKIRFE